MITDDTKFKMAALPVGDAWKRGDEEAISQIHDCYCPNCGGGKGRTLVLPTKVPGFREIIIMSLTCADCGFRNSEVSFGGTIQPQGSTITLTLENPEDLNRQVLKSDSTTAKLPSLDLDIPPSTQKGVVTTVEGMLSRVAENLIERQPDRLRMGDVDNFYRCKAVIDKIQRIIGKTDDDDLEDCSDGLHPSPFPFHLILDDPAGNASIENLQAPQADPQLETVNYDRTPNQDMSLGLQPSTSAIRDGAINDDNPRHKNERNTSSKIDISMEQDIGRHETMKFPTTCPQCQHPSETKVCVIDIPHFKEVVIMSLACENCGFKSNEIKGGGAIPKCGSKIALTVSIPEDLEREVLKSDSAGIQIPDLELELLEGGLDGVYTTVEGLLNKMRERLEEANPFSSGDSILKQHRDNDGGGFSAPDSTNARYIGFLGDIKRMANGDMFPFTLIITDPLANSFIGPIPKDALALALQAEKEDSHVCYDRYEDPRVEIQEIERSHEQNEVLGLNDMKTEGYGNGVYYGTDRLDDVDGRRQVVKTGRDHPL
jgi:zinc finger protein